MSQIVNLSRSTLGLTDADDFTERKAERERAAKELAARDRQARKDLARSDPSWAAARRELAAAEAARKKALEPSSDVADEELEAARLMGVSEDAYKAHRERKKAALRKDAESLDDAAGDGTVARRRAGKTGPGSHDFADPDDGTHGHEADRRGEQRRAALAAGERAALTREELQVAQLVDVDPVTLAKRIAEGGGMRIAAGVDKDEDED